MQGMREILRDELGRSLKAMPELDRLRAAWTVACGKTMAERGFVSGFEQGVVAIEAESPVWLAQMLSMRAVLEQELARIAAVKVSAIHFSLQKNLGKKFGSEQQ
jgi:predicted nucleic acid-binding Zn ribbon protein